MSHTPQEAFRLMQEANRTKELDGIYADHVRHAQEAEKEGRWKDASRHWLNAGCLTLSHDLWKQHRARQDECEVKAESQQSFNG